MSFFLAESCSKYHIRSAGKISPNVTPQASTGSTTGSSTGLIIGCVIAVVIIIIIVIVYFRYRRRRYKETPYRGDLNDRPYNDKPLTNIKRMIGIDRAARPRSETDTDSIELHDHDRDSMEVPESSGLVVNDTMARRL